MTKITTKVRTVLSEIEFHELLQEYYPVFEEIFSKSRSSTDDFIQLDLKNGIRRHDESFKSHMMWHYAMNHSAATFESHPEFKPVIYNKVYGLSFNDALFIRFKKLNQQFLTSGIQTAQAIAINNQWVIDGFPEKPCIITAGYISTATNTDNQGLYFVCHIGKKVLWKIDMLRYKEVGLNTEIPFVPFEEKVSKAMENLLKVKEDKKIKRKKDKDNDRA